ncbi:CHRD domain-containing protein [Aurantiacibacter luteus]|uniref:CHRD domain-containing protein n=1 Tax=Aurantiacibacter luteus TaxID=1581420 RepID=A0A0G9MY35_9SPHN|nr:CHRD domain-containing protein [Aurantiacibacter luteus]KLE34178.1 hypothetical protein AAW00_07865 [Aurantiacibacter luteus]
MTLSKFALLGTATAAAIVLAGCATLEEEVVDATSVTYHARLMGSNEVGGGDPQGMGEAEISVSDALDQVCYEVKDVRGIGPITAAHIHQGAAGTNGSPVFTMRVSNEGELQGCDPAPEGLQNMLQANPGNFYVNVHTAEFPNGAIRGQLMR